MALSVEVRTGSDAQVVITLWGELDQNTAAQLRDTVAAVLTAHPPHLRVDLGQVTFVDSAGLGALVSADKRCRQIGCHLVLDGISETLHQRLHITGLTEVLRLSESPQ
ncbi:STAS domain-containing protein [Dactylosporangium sp. NPDC005555]|uniref:STAS domain-containing protein n=1 Tax=Dactylosporangium sp. NPDC005555 TaxID=3154889 RepID=UPI0033AC0E1A